MSTLTQAEVVDIFFEALVEAVNGRTEIGKIAQTIPQAELAKLREILRRGAIEEIPPPRSPDTVCVHLSSWDEETIQLFGGGMKWNARKVLDWAQSLQGKSTGLADAIWKAAQGIQHYPLESVNVEMVLMGSPPPVEQTLPHT